MVSRKKGKSQELIRIIISSS